MSTETPDRTDSNSPTPEDADGVTGLDQVQLSRTTETCQCLSCGTDVPTDVGRVYGNNNDNVRACAVCWTDHNGNHTASSHASAAMHAITEGRL